MSLTSAVLKIPQFYAPRNKESGEVHYRILCSWAGGYVYGSSWKLSSGIASVEKQDGYFIMPQHSGSVYALDDTREGMSGIMAGVFENLSTEENPYVKMELLDFQSFLSEWQKFLVQ